MYQKLTITAFQEKWISTRPPLHCRISNNKTLLSHFFPHHYSLGKKVGQLKIDAAKLPVNEISKNW